METPFQKIVNGANQLEDYYKSIGIKPNKKSTRITSNTSGYDDLFATLFDYHTLGLAKNPSLNSLFITFAELNKHEQKLLKILDSVMSAENNEILIKSVTSIKDYKNEISRNVMYLICRDPCLIYRNPPRNN